MRGRSLPARIRIVTTMLNDDAEAATATVLLLTASHPSVELTVRFNCTAPLAPAV